MPRPGTRELSHAEYQCRRNGKVCTSQVRFRWLVVVNDKRTDASIVRNYKLSNFKSHRFPENAIAITQGFRAMSERDCSAI